MTAAGIQVLAALQARALLQALELKAREEAMRNAQAAERKAPRV